MPMIINAGAITAHDFQARAYSSELTAATSPRAAALSLPCFTVSQAACFRSATAVFSLAHVRYSTMPLK